MYINGVGLGQVQDWYARKIGYVLQLAVPYYEELTVRQNLFFAAHMRLPKETSAAKKYERVEQIIAEVSYSLSLWFNFGGNFLFYWSLEVGFTKQIQGHTQLGLPKEYCKGTLISFKLRPD